MTHAPPSPRFEAFAERMRHARQPPLAIRIFEGNFERLAAGATGLIPEEALRPVPQLPDADSFDEYAETGCVALAATCVIKLNGGLGTSMGMEQAKSLLPAKDGRSFLQICVDQVLYLRRALGIRLPLVLMDSFRTQADALAVLAQIPELAAAQAPVPLSFLQHQVPKVRAADLAPGDLALAAADDPALAWCPPGHGDLYAAIQTSGLLERLLANGFRYAFVSNSDNLGAAPDPAILGWMVAESRDFVMECCDRTEADKKGGHLAQTPDGEGLLLREVAQCPPENMPQFQDIARHKYFNTNNLWIDLLALRDLLAARGGDLGLPLIRNLKPLDPTVPASTPVYQLETAMGAAIAAFGHAGAVRVPRARFVPVKTTNDLLLLWSDVFVRGDDGRVAAIPECATNLPFVDLDPRHYRHIDAFTARFPEGPPSLERATRFVVRGDVTFPAGLAARGHVEVTRPDGVPPIDWSDPQALPPGLVARPGGRRADHPLDPE
jgi:UTP--glucose-1-phosphate uridylyltransferase